MESDISEYPLQVSHVKNVEVEMTHPIVAIHHTGCHCTMCPLNASYLRRHLAFHELAPADHALAGGRLLHEGGHWLKFYHGPLPLEKNVLQYLLGYFRICTPVLVHPLLQCLHPFR